MRILVAGATGAIGKCLLPQLVAAGHQVVGTTRSPEKVVWIRSTGAEPLVLDALERNAVMRAVEQARPEIIIHELTSLPSKLNFRQFERQFAMTNRLRTEATAYLLEAAGKVGIRRFVAQSFAGWPYAREGGPVKSESDPLDRHPPKAFSSILSAIRYLESSVTAAREFDGIVLRYGLFYGPSEMVGDGIIDILQQVRRRRFPIVGNGSGVWSFVHVHDAARATVAAAERGSPGIYNIVDDEPVRVSDLITELARMVNGPPPLHMPTWVARLVMGKAGLNFMTQVRGASNRKAKSHLGWTPEWNTWRTGFRLGIGSGELSHLSKAS